MNEKSHAVYGRKDVTVILMNRYLYLAVVLAVLAGSASAGTVVLTGSCPSGVAQNSINFSLVNSGNDTASNLVLTPYFENVKLVKSQYTLPSIGDGSTVHFNISFSNVTQEGTYSDYFILAYQQGSGQPFTALFPCMISLYNRTVSEVFVTTNVINGGSGSIVNVSIFNAGSESLVVNASILLPPTLVHGSSPSIILDMPPYAQRVVNFSVQTPPNGASYSAAVAAVYSFGGKHYASESIFAIAGAGVSSQGFGFGTYLPFLALVVVILVVLALIVRIVIGNKKRKHQDKDQLL